LILSLPTVDGWNVVVAIIVSAEVDGHGLAVGGEGVSL